MKYLVALFFLIPFYPKLNGQITVKIEDINNHIGDSVTICSKVFEAVHQPRVKGAPTYLYIGNLYPEQPLTVLIERKDRANFDDRPEMKYVCKEVCVSGRLVLYNGKAGMIVTVPEQIVIQQQN